MAWAIEYDSRVVKDMKKLDKKVQQQIIAYFDERIAPSSDPCTLDKSLKSSFSGLWRYRIGDYRVVCRIEDKQLVVLVIHIAHRSKVYKKPFKAR
ncbi:type II toxin-antitoxin system RelE family toxin [Nitrospira sp. M1]